MGAGPARENVTSRPRKATPSLPPPPRLIALEGIDGAGKTVLREALAERLRRRGWRVGLWKEPSDTVLGQAAKHFAGVDPAHSAFLFTLDRAAQREALEELLAAHDVVLSDRSYFSTLAYQGSQVSPGEREELERWQRQLARTPDRVLWLDLPPREALQRVRHRGAPAFSLERRNVLELAARRYRKFAEQDPVRFRRLDAGAPPARVLEAAWAAISGELPPPRSPAGSLKGGRRRKPQEARRSGTSVRAKGRSTGRRRGPR